MANSLHLKASRTQILNSLPNKSFGKEGDIVVSNIKGKGVYLCIKTGGMWYTANRMSELSKIDKTPLNIIAKKLRIKNIKNSFEGNKFVVSEGDGELKYRNSEQLLSDLDSDALSIDYKTSYCSLGQYTNKEECEANNGTWYYSENESHDNISSTAENQLLTIGQSIGELDSEPTLLYDGSTLEIKRNTNFDDNWQTSAQDTLLKLSYDSSNNTTLGVSSGGDFTITPSGGDTTLSSSTLTIGTIAEIGSDTDKILMSDSGVVKYVDGATLRGYIGAGTSSVGALNDLSDVTYSGGDLTITSLDKIVVSGDLSIDADGGQVKITDDDESHFDFDCDNTRLRIFDDTTSNDHLTIAVDTNGVATISTEDNDGAVGHLTLIPDGDLKLDPVSGNTIISATDKLFFDGGGDTYLYEQGADIFRLIVGGDMIMQITEQGTDGNQVHFYNTSVGFTQFTPTYNASNTIVDFRHSNKQFLTFDGGDITNLQIYFPTMSGNFVLLIKQDGTGSRTITNYRAYEFDESTADGDNEVKFAGGSNPTLTTDANHVDIISIYWDADYEIAYGVASLDFQD